MNIPNLAGARARVAVVENVDEPDGVGAIDTALTAVGGYDWYSQSICPSVHCGMPIRRLRRYWVGVRREPGLFS